MADSPKISQQPSTAEGSKAAKTHSDFKKTEACRPDWDEDTTFTLCQTKKPNWHWGDGATDDGACLKKDHIEINPADPERSALSNYKLLISSIIPRPIGFVSTLSEDGRSSNLAPMSYFTVVNHDPPIFVLGFAGGFDKMKDTLRNLVETHECTINIISEHFVEAANATSINAPYGVSEWALSGLTPAKCTNVKPPRVRESIFSVECKLIETKEFASQKHPGKKEGAMAIIEGARFWVREDAMNADRSAIDPAVLRPMSRLGGMQYGRLTSAMELLRPVYGRDLKEP